VRERLARKEEELMGGADAFMNEQLGSREDYVRVARDQVPPVSAPVPCGCG
jgi:hypothetical protein